ncbi:MAG: hypothetical protein EOL87_18805, partial [Spartobacteria bacterium]|nr:hypothetical protein [Spartobacteria bacterium]
FTSDDLNSPFQLNVAGSCYQTSTNNGPYAGGNSITITNGYFGNITNVLVGPPSVCSAIPTAQGDNWFTITLPPATNAGTVSLTVQTSNNGDTTLANAYTYNPAGAILPGLDWSAWQEVLGLPAPRRLAVGAVMNGAFYFAGGRDGSNSAATNVYRFDGTNWTEVAGLPAARYQAAGGVLTDGFIVSGGYDGSSARTNAYQYDGTNWTEILGYPGWRDRQQQGYAVLSNKLYCWSGSTGGYSLRDDALMFDGSTWTTNPAPGLMSYPAGVSWNGKIYSIGGSYSVDLNNVSSFSGTEWSNEPGLPIGRKQQMAVAFDDKIYAIGYTTNVYTFDGTNWAAGPSLPTGRSMMSAGVLNGAIYACGGGDNFQTSQTNVYRYPAMNTGVSPLSGSWVGGYQVTISGENLGDGTDITNVTLCGVSADSIVSQSATQVVIVAGASSAGISGDVVVYSTSFGTTTKSNAFTYNAAGIEVTAPAFAPTPLNTVLTNIFTVTNTGNEALLITAATNNGAGSAYFDVSVLDGLTVTPGTASNVPVVFSASAIGTFTPTCYVANNSPIPSYTFALTG